MGDYRKLAVWAAAMSLVEECYRLTLAFPRTEQYGMSAQIRRAAVSIPSNIAEGHNRGGRPSFAAHVNIALGSQAELETQLELAGRLGFADQQALLKALELAGATGRMLHGLAASLARAPRQACPQPHARTAERTPLRNDGA